MKNRREFLQKSVLGIAGVLTAPSWLQGAPALIKSLGRPNSLINGVQIGCITYSFRSLADQSAEATLQYVLDSGISSIELIPRIKVNAQVGETVEIFYSETLEDGDWNFLARTEVTEDPFYFYDESRAQGKRFYRVGENPPAGPPGYVWIPPGEFMMGSPESEEGRDNDEHLHPVRITYGFWMKETEVTQGEFEPVVGYSRYWSKGFWKPVSKMTFDEAMEYCQILTERSQNKGEIPLNYEYRLPTEAEWEYACRAGTQTAFWYGDEYDLSKSTVHIGNIHEVKRSHPNFFGLYEMHGNVSELVMDKHANYFFGILNDPVYVDTTSWISRSFRGGDSYENHDKERQNSRSARRGAFIHPSGMETVGFRTVISKKFDLLNQFGPNGLIN